MQTIETNRISAWILGADSASLIVLRDALGAEYHLRVFNKTSDLEQVHQGDWGAWRVIFIDLDSTLLTQSAALDFSRQNLLHTRIIVFSTRQNMHFMSEAFDRGANDCMLKPLTIEETRLRLQIALKARRESSDTALALIRSFGTKLTFTEQKILVLFLTSVDHRVSRTSLVENVWRAGRVHPKTLDVHLFNLRKKIAPIGYSIVPGGEVGIWRLERCKPGQTLPTQTMIDPPKNEESRGVAWPTPLPSKTNRGSD